MSRPPVTLPATLTVAYPPLANLSVSIFPLELLPAVFRYGYAAPFYNLSKAIRVIVFGTRNRSASARYSPFFNF